MTISLKYKIEDRHSKITLDIINAIGYNSAMSLAYNKSVEVVTKSVDSILPVILLAWSMNLQKDARDQSSEDLRTLASFYRILAHKVYFFQRKNDLIGVLPDFIQEVE